VLVLSFTDLVQSLHPFFLLMLQLLKELINFSCWKLFICFKERNNSANLIERYLSSRWVEVDSHRERKIAKHVKLFPLTVDFHVEEKLIFCRYRSMPFNMIHKLFKPVLRKAIENDTNRKRLPFEVENVCVWSFLPCWVVLLKLHYGLIGLLY